MNMETVKQTMRQGDRYIRMVVDSPVRVPEVIRALGIRALEKYLKAFLSFYHVKTVKESLNVEVQVLQKLFMKRSELFAGLKNRKYMEKTLLLLRMVEQNPFDVSEAAVCLAGSMMRQLLEMALRTRVECSPKEAA